MKELEILYNRLRESAPALELRRDEPMSRHTTFRVGGPAALMALPAGEAEAAACVSAAHALGVKPFFLGNGSNLLVSDGGYDGFLVKPAGALCQARREDNALTAGSGALLSAVANAALEGGFTGLEFASGIPGAVGGGVVMNAGAYGGEMAQVVKAVIYLDETGEAHTLSNEGCQFSYRHSVFTDHPERLVLSALFRLEPGEREAVRGRMAELTRRRRERQPLEYPSAGSTFKRPPPVNGEPVYAAALIDQCGLKGLTVGGARVSEKHAGFVVNTGGATCRDILALMEQVRARVYAETGIELEAEVRYLR